MVQRDTAGQGPGRLCVYTHPRTQTSDSLDMICLVSSPSLIFTDSYHLSVTSGLLLDHPSAAAWITQTSTCTLNRIQF